MKTFKIKYTISLNNRSNVTKFEIIQAESAVGAQLAISPSATILSIEDVTTTKLAYDSATIGYRMGKHSVEAKIAREMLDNVRMSIGLDTIVVTKEDENILMQASLILNRIALNNGEYDATKQAEKLVTL